MYNVFYISCHQLRLMFAFRVRAPQRTQRRFAVSFLFHRSICVYLMKIDSIRFRSNKHRMQIEQIVFNFSIRSNAYSREHNKSNLSNDYTSSMHLPGSTIRKSVLKQLGGKLNSKTCLQWRADEWTPAMTNRRWETKKKKTRDKTRGRACFRRGEIARECGVLHGFTLAFHTNRRNHGKIPRAAPGRKSNAFRINVHCTRIRFDRMCSVGNTTQAGYRRVRFRSCHTAANALKITIFLGSLFCRTAASCFDWTSIIKNRNNKNNNGHNVGAMTSTPPLLLRRVTFNR